MGTSDLAEWSLKFKQGILQLLFFISEPIIKNNYNGGIHAAVKNVSNGVVMAIVRNVKNCIKWFIPFGLMHGRHKKLIEYFGNIRYKKHNEIRKYFLSLNVNENNTEITEIVDYFKENKFSIFPYKFTKNYWQKHIEVFYDNSCNMCFVLHDGKKLYFPEGWNLEVAGNYYNGLLLEQDKESPHRYETDEYIVKNGDIIEI